MFRCDYILDGECQLYSEPCRSKETKKCKLFNECHSCIYKMALVESPSCIKCSALHKKKKASK